VCALPTEASGGRGAVVVGKAVDKRAVVRHRWQRRLRAQYKQLCEDQPGAQRYDMVWIAQRGIVDHERVGALASVVGDVAAKIISKK